MTPCVCECEQDGAKFCRFKQEHGSAAQESGWSTDLTAIWTCHLYLAPYKTPKYWKTGDTETDKHSCSRSHLRPIMNPLLCWQTCWTIGESQSSEILSVVKIRGNAIRPIAVSALLQVYFSKHFAETKLFKKRFSSEPNLGGFCGLFYYTFSYTAGI